MLNISTKIIAFCNFIVISNVAIAAPVTSENTQSAMLARISEKVNSYARKIKISTQFVDYCQNEMYLHTYEHPVNGFIPFGVNYNEIKTEKQMESVLSARESYETSYLILCLAKAKNTLSDAERQ